MPLELASILHPVGINILLRDTPRPYVVDLFRLPLLHFRFPLSG